MQLDVDLARHIDGCTTRGTSSFESVRLLYAPAAECVATNESARVDEEQVAYAAESASADGSGSWTRGAFRLGMLRRCQSCWYHFRRSRCLSPGVQGQFLFWKARRNITDDERAECALPCATSARARG